MNIYTGHNMNWTLVIIVIVVALAVLAGYLLLSKHGKEIVGGYFGGDVLTNAEVDNALHGSYQLSPAQLNGALIGAAELTSGQLQGALIGAHQLSSGQLGDALAGAAELSSAQVQAALIGGNAFDWVNADPDGAIFQGGCCGADDTLGGAPAAKKPAARPDGPRVDFISGVMQDDKGNLGLYGAGRVSNREFNNVEMAGKFTLDSVKVKDTLRVNGHVQAFNVTAKNVEVAGSGYFVKCTIDKLVIKNKKTDSSRPSVIVIEGDVKHIELADKSAKVEDFVIRKAGR